jgi:hypothetical protein
MKRTFFLLILCACVCAYSLPALAWGQEGHRIIAKIAYDNLSSKAKKGVDKVLGKQGMIYWANWPDEIKSDNIYPQSIQDGWHYQDFDGGLTDDVIAASLILYPEDGGKLFKALDSLVNSFWGSDYENHTLRFIIHLSGDRYCPMHIAHKDDKGGNAVKMGWFSKQNNTNLHSVWDSKLIESQGYSFTEYAQMLEDMYDDQKKEILDMSDSELLIQTYHLTEAIYAYQETWDGNTYHYIYRWHEPMEKQLYIAGIRLARLLNDMYR